jgi:non-specific serine/threonine protein kinase
MADIVLTPHSTLSFAGLTGDWRDNLFDLAARREPPEDPATGFWRSVADDFLVALCRLPEDGNPAAMALPSLLDLSLKVESAPPLPGGEYLSTETLVLIWMKLSGWCGLAVTTAGGLTAFLDKRAPKWRRVGRVTFHLAENKADPSRPFAFMATYVVGLNEAGRDRHLPLGQALRQYAGLEDRPALVRLLSPVQAAADKIPWVSELVENGAVYQPLAFTIQKAHRFLLDIPILEDSGLTVRIPDWWKKRSQVRVRLDIGEKKKPSLGLESLIDWDVHLAVGDQKLTPDEIREILSSDEKLIFFKGEWLEVDRDKLSEALAHWQKAKAASRDGEISFGQAMRLLAGLPGNASALDDDDASSIDVGWVQAEAGAALREILKKLRDPEAASVPADLKAELRAYQKQGLAWLSLLSGLGLGACLADDMGLGKTMQTLALLLADKNRSGRQAGAAPSLLVTPASLLSNWKAEIEAFAPSLRFKIYHPSETPKERLAAWDVSPQALRQDVDLVMVSYAMLARKAELFNASPWRLMIIDEAQAIKNHGSGQSRAVKKIKAESRIALTGTPVENRLSDLWSLFDFLNPGLLGSAKAFKTAVSTLENRSLEQRSNDRYGPLRRLVSPYILRRLKTDRRIINDLPDKTETTLYCHLQAPQARLYSQIVNQLQKELKDFSNSPDDQKKRRGLVLQSLMRLKQLCNHPAQLTGDGAWDGDLSGKFQRVGELAGEMAERQDKVLIFTQFQEIIDPLSSWMASIFRRPGLNLHGGTPVKQRKTLVDKFQADDGPPFFILSLKAGGTGLNLTAANQVIHFDRWWNPAVEDQATDRAFRIGQKRNVLIHKCVTQGTLEERIDQMLRDKRSLAGEILGGDSEVNLVNLGDEALLDLVRLDLSRAIL